MGGSGENEGGDEGVEGGGVIRREGGREKEKVERK